MGAPEGSLEVGIHSVAFAGMVLHFAKCKYNCTRISRGTLPLSKLPAALQNPESAKEPGYPINAGLHPLPVPH